MGKLTVVLTAICAGMLALSDNASAIGSPEMAAGNTSRERYVNFMVGLSPGNAGHVTISGQDNLALRSRTNADSETRYIGDLREITTIPGNWGQHRRSSRTLLPPSPITVPDGGVTLIMLGATLVILGIVRRYSTGHLR